MGECRACRESTSGSCWQHPRFVYVGPVGANTIPTRQCPTCNGTGINPVANYLLCPKCHGEKWLSS